MTDFFNDFDDRILIELCMDLAVAIDSRVKEDLAYKYHGLIEIGRLAHFLQALLRKNTESTLKMPIFHKLATVFNITQTYTLFDFNESCEINPITMEEEENVTINLETYIDIIKYCKNKLEESEHKKLIDSKFQKLLIHILYSGLIPRKFEFYMNYIDDPNILKEILNDCMNLGLIIKEDQYYYTPRLFKNVDKETLELLTDYDIGSNILIENMEKVQKCPAYPIDSIDDRIKEATLQGAFKGILLPISIKLPDDSYKTFIFTDPKDLDCGDLGFETASYFRYNEIYTSPEHGQLFSPSMFLNSLITKGIAGDATNIGKYYFPLELKGVIKIVRGSTSNKNSMVSLKPNVLKESKKLLENEFTDKVREVVDPPNWLQSPAEYRSRVTNSERIKHNILELKKFLRDY